MKHPAPPTFLEQACGRPIDCSDCAIKPCQDAVKIHEAVNLIQAGARATLVCQLTELPKKLVKRIYLMLQGQPSPRGQTPFTDAWYLENDLRMLHASLVWQLHNRLSRQHRSEAGIVLDVYLAYRCKVDKPQLDLTRTVFVLTLITMDLWRERRCDSCGCPFLAPADERCRLDCPGCRLYHRYRCHHCGATLNAHQLGRPRTTCRQCSGAGSARTARTTGRVT